MDNIQVTKDAEANARAMACVGSMVNALAAIANMQIKEETNKSKALAICIAIAQIELEKLQRNL